MNTNDNKRLHIDLNEGHEQYISYINSDLIDSKRIWLPRWTITHGSHLINGNSMLRARNKKRYERKNIIRVDFGVGVGKEFCGIHYAVVISKNDSNNKEILTVVPLTSKKSGERENNDSRIQLGYSVFTSIVRQLVLELESIKEDESHIESLRLLFNNINEQPSDQDVTSFPDVFESILNGLNVKSKKSFTIKKVEDIPSILERVSKDLMIKRKQLSALITFYKSDDKETVALVHDSIAISKMRIKASINRLDPIGNVSISDESMELIAKGLRRHLGL